MSTELLGLYRPGSTLLHRAPPGGKLLGLCLTGLLVVAVGGPLSTAVLLTLTVALLIWSGTGLRALLRTLRGLALMVLLLGAWQTWQHGWARAFESVGDLVGLVLLATVLTVTTPVDALLDSLTRALRPFHRLGVDADQVALAFALMLRAVPGTLEIAAETRDAAAARGLSRDPRARLTPLVIRVVARARATGEALQARGIGD